ncbi:MAG TPA: hypothetical protein VKY74_14225 [Chloroflexia bacterium]|nr:hypothetical protein [Chloroflexia bacterium]
MAVYREKKRPRLLVLGLIGAGALIVLGGIVAVLGAGRPVGETPRSRVQRSLRDMSEALDLFAIEYPKSQAGQPSGAGPALARARQAFEAARPDLATIDPTQATAFGTALTSIERQVAAHAGVAAVLPPVTQLRADLAAWLQHP